MPKVSAFEMRGEFAIDQQGTPIRVVPTLVGDPELVSLRVLHGQQAAVASRVDRNVTAGVKLKAMAARYVNEPDAVDLEIRGSVPQSDDKRRDIQVLNEFFHSRLRNRFHPPNQERTAMHVGV